jgi:hypothetical protein
MTVPMKKTQTPELYNDGVRRIFYNGQMTEVEKPVLIDMSSLFDNFVTIVLNHRVEPRSMIGFEVVLNQDVHSVVAKVVSVRQMAMGFETRVLIDLIPEELIQEIEELLSQQALILDSKYF